MPFININDDDDAPSEYHVKAGDRWFARQTKDGDWGVFEAGHGYIETGLSKSDAESKAVLANSMEQDLIMLKGRRKK